MRRNDGTDVYVDGINDDDDYGDADHGNDDVWCVPSFKNLFLPNEFTK